MLLFHLYPHSTALNYSDVQILGVAFGLNLNNTKYERHD